MMDDKPDWVVIGLVVAVVVVFLLGIYGTVAADQSCREKGGVYESFNNSEYKCFDKDFYDRTVIDE